MSFRQFGGLQYTAKHNIVSSNFNTSNNLSVTNNVGQPNSHINFLSDISGNIIGKTTISNFNNIGTTGPTGKQGISYTGPAGISYTGPTGKSYTGPAGISYTGPAGKSYTGPAGISYTGPAGKSYTGPVGPTGSSGVSYTGPQGIQGFPGIPTFGTINNFGLNWSKTGVVSNWASVAISLTGQYQTAVSSGYNTGIISTSNNFGSSWNVIPYTAYNDWQCVAMSSTGQYQTGVINNGGIVRSINYGATWNLVSGTNNTWTSVCVSMTGQYQTAVTSGIVGGIFISKNYGETWNQVPNINGNWITVSMSLIGQYQVVASSGSNGLIYISNNFGETWNAVSGLYNDWQSVSISSSGQYITACVQYNNYIYTSNNYGLLWSSTLITNNYSNFFSVAISGNGQYQTAVVNGVGGLIYISNNYGLTWNSVPNMTGNWTYAAISTNAQYLIACNSGDKLYMSVSNSNGSTGATGPAGRDGINGATGPAGRDGINGASGPAGRDGISYTGPAGISYTGPAGRDGIDGISYTGLAGRDGATGLAGRDGATGLAGRDGISYTGPAGKDGISYTGPAGISYTGPAGISYTGPAGISYTGPAGISYTGPAGRDGVTGPAGISYTGPAGISYTGPTGAGALYWNQIVNTNDIQNTNLGNVIIGPTGQLLGQGSTLNVNGVINVNGNPSLAIITSTNPNNVPTLQTSANGNYHYYEFINPDTYNIQLNSSFITNYNYILVGPGGSGTAANPQCGGAGGGYVIGTSINTLNNSNLTVFTSASNTSPNYSRLSINSNIIATANSGANAVANSFPVGGTASVTSGYGTAYAGINGSSGGVAGSTPPLSITFDSTTIQYEIGGVPDASRNPTSGQKGGGGGGGGNPSAGILPGLGGNGYMLLYFQAPTYTPSYASTTITPININSNNISAQNISTQSTSGGVGYASLSQGTNVEPGYINFYDLSNNRAAYIGWSDGNKNIYMHADGSTELGGTYYTGFSMNGNFLLNQTNYPPISNLQLGYSFNSGIKTSPVISLLTGSLPSNLVSLALPVGVWLVEGQIEAAFSSCNIYTFSLSTTSQTIDFTRVNVNYINNVPTTFSSHITSVFVINSPKNVYLVGYLTSGTSSSNSNIITATKIG
jgi:hypothetical protein